MFNYLMSIIVTMICISIITDYTYLDYIYERESIPNLSFPITHKVMLSHNIFIKSNFVMKNSGMYIDCIFRNQSIFIKNHNILVSISRNQ